MVRRTYVPSGVPVVPSIRSATGLCVSAGPRGGIASVKKQTVILVVIGVLLFVAGSAIAFASVEGASKHTQRTEHRGIERDVGGRGQVEHPGRHDRGLDGLQRPRGHRADPDEERDPDRSRLAGRPHNQVLTQAVKKGQAISSTQLSPSASSISVPTGLDAVTVTLTGTNSLAGYLQPGSRVDVYANVTKTSANSGASSTLPLPCTELAMANVQVLDVQSTVPSYAGHRSTSGRTIPASETLLLAVNPSQSSTIEFLSQNESLSVVQTQQDANPPPLHAVHRHRPDDGSPHDHPADPRHQPLAGAQPGHPGVARPRLSGRDQQQRGRRRRRGPRAGTVRRAGRRSRVRQPRRHGTPGLVAGDLGGARARTGARPQTQGLPGRHRAQRAPSSWSSTRRASASSPLLSSGRSTSPTSRSRVRRPRSRWSATGSWSSGPSSPRSSRSPRRAVAAARRSTPPTWPAIWRPRPANGSAWSTSTCSSARSPPRCTFDPGSPSRTCSRGTRWTTTTSKRTSRSSSRTTSSGSRCWRRHSARLTPT